MQRIAIVGIGGLFPGAAGTEGHTQTEGNLETFWKNIQTGRDCSREVPEDRWLLNKDDVWSSELAADKVNSIRGCFLDSLQLDPADLDLDKNILAKMDPMFHVLLHAGRQAWQDANNDKLDKHKINKQRVGVIIGNIVLPTDSSSALADETLGPVFESQLLGPQAEENNKTESLNRYVAGLPAGMLAKALGFGGGTYTLDAACASSLYALKYAVEELIAGRADAMLTGGLSRPDCLYTQMGFSALGAISKTGHCSPFDHKGDGLVVGEGAGILVLKRLEDALRDEDHIYATIAGVGLSNDIGGNLMSPDSEGQLRAMRNAYFQADWSPEDVDLIECHGTGTPIGDAEEIKSLKSLWSKSYTGTGSDVNECVIGSVKSNIGHLLTAAGSAGLIKVLLAMKHQQLPPTANFENTSAKIDLTESPFTVLSNAKAWEKRSDQTPRRAAVSAFGFGGINAHVLLEEWQPDQTTEASHTTEPKPDIAIVGMEAQFGPWKSLATFKERMFTDKQDLDTELPKHWWGIDNPDQIKGWFINEVNVPLGRYRIPPAELKEMLPQQLLMLEVAANALEDAGIEELSKDESNTTGVFIGIGLDLNTTNFHFRWSLLNRAKIWARRLDLNLNDKEFKDWTQSLRDTAGPALNANRTMGALGGIVASRIARAFRIGGPSFTVSSEESSGLRALEAGVRALQRGELNTAIVGAVDLAGDARATLAQHHRRAYSEETLIGEGATAFILKRYEDAIRDGDRIYSVIKGIGSANGGGADQIVPTTNAYQQAFSNACKDAKTELANISLFETHSSGLQQEDTMEQSALDILFDGQEATKEKIPHTISHIKSKIGHTGAASGLASVAKASLALYHKQLTDGDQTSYWLRNKIDGSRQAAVSAFSVDGNCLHTILEEADQHSGAAITHTNETLFTFHAETKDGLLKNFQQLHSLVNNAQDIHTLAIKWWLDNKGEQEKEFTAAIVTNSNSELADALSKLQVAVEKNESINTDGIYFSSKPLNEEGKLAFVYPGSGNHFYGMGRELGQQWPQVLDRLDDENDSLAAQFANGKFWQSEVEHSLTHEEVIFGQVWLGTFVSDVVSQFNISPDAIIGYSLGETAGLFSTRAWTDRDEMLRRIRETELFTDALAGPCDSVRETWQLKDSETVDWLIGVVDRTAEEVKQALADHPRTYLLIINSPKECVIGGDRTAILEVVNNLACHFHPIQGVTTVHCDVAEPVKKPYRDLHLFETNPPDDITFYSGVWGKAYEVTRDSAADSIVEQAVQPFDYTKVIESAYEDGVRIFIEMGPGATCSRMIDKILEDKPHMAKALCVKNQNSVSNILHCLGQLIAEHVDVDLNHFFNLDISKPTEESRSMITVRTGAENFEIPPLPKQNKADQKQGVEIPVAAMVTDNVHMLQPIIDQMQRTETARAEAQETFLRVSNGLTETLGQALDMQMQLLKPSSTSEDFRSRSRKPRTENRNVQLVHEDSSTELTQRSRENIACLFDRDQCMEIAIGSISKVLGAKFAEIDQHPTRVRLPDEPLMLVDRIMEIHGEAASLAANPSTSGSIITEHDVLHDDWYLDGGRMPTCIAVEAGQADLFLSGYLGIDHITKGQAVYRLLDARITFHGPLPRPGEVIRYDIHIDEFFKQDETYLFRFGFEGTVNGQPLLTMTEGCAGFFTQAELDAGKGIVQTELETRPQAGQLPDNWQAPVPMGVESYNDEHLNALREGSLGECFGAAFSNLSLNRCVGLPGGRMTLVHRILNLDPTAGRFRIGQITGEADIHPDDWFLTCHFSDDQVMPGTLMYECCLHTLRVYLLRMGWVGEIDEIVYEPIIGEVSQLKCRGQVIESTKKVQYEVTLKEIGYKDDDGTPYVLADALMYADGRPIVQMNNMSVQLSGLNKQKIEALWKNQTTEKTILFDFDSIYAFANGKPSEAFGDRYKVFDEKRKIARLPRPPYQFLDRITSIKDCEQWILKAGGVIDAEYDVPKNEWYFKEDRQTHMPFAVLLEVALQPCGWLAAYLGSALTSEIDLSFRNLGGNGTQLLAVTPSTGTLTTRIKITNVSQSGGMIIQNYDMEVRCDAGIVYKGDTYFGFFSKQSLADQVGIRDTTPYEPDEASSARGTSFQYPNTAPYPDDMMRMVSNVTLFDPQGGPNGLGFIRGTTEVDPERWFFKAHFFEDPVWPGSLGLESFIQLLKVVAVGQWSGEINMDQCDFEVMALNETHHWIYRGQIIPKDEKVTVQAVITKIDQDRKLIRADGFLTVDGRIIYQMNDFALRIT
jgi:PfaB family protein